MKSISLVKDTNASSATTIAAHGPNIAHLLASLLSFVSTCISPPMSAPHTLQFPFTHGLPHCSIP